jgi:hypothetical protein
MNAERPRAAARAGDLRSRCSKGVYLYEVDRPV